MITESKDVIAKEKVGKLRMKDAIVRKGTNVIGVG